jgi:excisionase family DNA binding protein
MTEIPNDLNNRLSWSVRQLASDLGCGQSTIRKWIAQGTVPAKRLGGRVLIPGDWVRQQFQDAMDEWEGQGEIAPVVIVSPSPTTSGPVDA